MLRVIDSDELFDLPPLPTETKYNIDFDFEDIKDELYKRHEQGEKYKYEKFLAAKKIQALFRGYWHRKCIKDLGCKSTIIQKWVRGFLARKRYYYLVEDTLQEKLTYIYTNATGIIQKFYRGHLSRKHTFDYYQMKRWIRIIAAKNDESEENAMDYFDLEESEQQQLHEAAAFTLCRYIGLKLHHVLRTYAIPGVFSIHNKKSLSIIETFLYAFKRYNPIEKIKEHNAANRAAYLKEVDKLYDRTGKEPNKFTRCEKFWRDKDIDMIESQMNVIQRVTGTEFKTGKIRYPYITSVFKGLKYCDEIMTISRNYDILKEGKQFTLNTRVAHYPPDHLSRYLQEIKNFCKLHQLIEK